MATIKEFQDVLKSKSNRLLIEQSLGKNLISRIESGGGSWKIHDSKNIYEFINVPIDLKPELDEKLLHAQQRINDVEQQWKVLIG